MSNEFNINIVLNSLKKFGIDKKFINEILLPDWWTPDIAITKAGYLQTLSIIAKNLGINFENLITDPENISLKQIVPIKYKTAHNINIDSKNIWPRSLAMRISEIVEKTYSIPYKELPEDSLQLRNEILKNFESVNLESVLNYLWSSGVPVLYVSEFPRDIYKMDGMAIYFNRRPIILISQNRRQNAWVLFILSHEIGHIIKKHISEKDPVIYDLEFEQFIDDKEEMDANQEALKLLTGNEKPSFIKERIESSYKLAILARKIGFEKKIDPGTIVLNYAYLNNDYPLAQQALKVLDPRADAISLIKANMLKYLKLDELTEENFEYFAKITTLIEEPVGTVS